MGVLYFYISLFNDRLTVKKTPPDYHFTELCTHVVSMSIFSITSHPLPVSCIFHTPVLLIHSGWGRCFHAAGWCSSPGCWSEAAGWRHRRCEPLLSDWGQSTQPSCKAASCSRHCTETHWRQRNTELHNEGLFTKRQNFNRIHLRYKLIFLKMFRCYYYYYTDINDIQLFCFFICLFCLNTFSMQTFCPIYVNIV